MKGGGTLAACARPSQTPTDSSHLSFLCFLSHASLPRRDSGPQPLPGPFRNTTSCGLRSWATVTTASVACLTTERTMPSAPSSWGSPWWRPSRKRGTSGRRVPGPVGEAALMCRSHGGRRTPRPPRRDPFRHVMRGRSDVTWRVAMVGRSLGPQLWGVGSRSPSSQRRESAGPLGLRGALFQPSALFSPGS